MRIERAERVDQILDRPLVHARQTVELVLAVCEREHRRHRSECRTGVAEVQLGRALAKPAAGALDQGQTVREPRETNARACISASTMYRVSSDTSRSRIVVVAFRERREQQNAVRNAFRAGQPNGAAQAANGGEIEVVHEPIRQR